MTDNIELYTSPEYDEKLPEYELHKDLYQGINSVLRSPVYLPYHELEQDQTVEGAKQIRKTRESLTRYTNFCARAFRRYKSILFQEPPVYDEEAQKFLEDNKLENNIDGKGTNIDSFIKNTLFKSKFVYGDSFLLTTAEDKKPIWDVPSPIAVKDYSVTSGKVSLFRYEYEVTEPRTKSTEEPLSMIYSDEYYLENDKVYLNRYKRERSENLPKGEKPKWQIVEADKLITNFDEIPVAPNSGDSFIADPANDILDYFNLKSAKMNQLYHQAFDRIMVSGAVEEDQQFALSAFTVTIIRTKVGEPNATVTNIPAADTSALTEQMAESEENIFKAFYHLNRSIDSGSGNTESAEAQEMAKDDLLNVIKTEIEDLERQVNKGLQQLALQAGVKNFTGTVTFNKTIDIADLVAELQEEMAYYGIVRGRFPLWEKALLKKAARRQGLDNEEEIIDEIEEFQEVEPPTINLGFTEEATEEPEV